MDTLHTFLGAFTLNQIPPEDTRTKLLLLAANVGVILFVVFCAWLVDVIGPGFAFGAIFGGAVIALVVRLELGYWP